MNVVGCFGDINLQVDRKLPKIDMEDYIYIHDTGGLHLLWGIITTADYVQLNCC